MRVFLLFEFPTGWKLWKNFPAIQDPRGRFFQILPFLPNFGTKSNFFQARQFFPKLDFQFPFIPWKIFPALPIIRRKPLPVFPEIRKNTPRKRKKLQLLVALPFPFYSISSKILRKRSCGIFQHIPFEG